VTHFTLSTHTFGEAALSKTSKQAPKKTTAVAPAKGIEGLVIYQMIDDSEAQTKPSREDRASRFIWGPDDVEHH
jgi:hypothetical protein